MSDTQGAPTNDTYPRSVPTEDTTQFYIAGTKLNEDLRRCETSLQQRQRITLIGTTAEGKIKAFTGVVQSVELQPDTPQGRRWRVTIANR